MACFDPHYVAGGCATQFSRRNASGSYQFDVGLHYIGDCGPHGAIPRILASLGIEQEFLPLDPDGFDVLRFPDLEMRVPASLDRYRDRLASLFPSEKRGIDRYVSLVRQVGTVGQRIDQNRGRLTPKLLLDLAWNGRLLPFAQKATIAQFLDSCTRDPKLRAVILGQHGDYGLPPSEVAALLHVGLADHYFKGAYYPRGGGQIMSDKLASAIEAAGGSIHLKRGIAKIIIEEGRAVGVRTEPRAGEVHEVRAGVVLSNADLKRTLLELVGPAYLPAASVRRVRNYQMGGAIFMTFLGVAADLRKDGLGAHNLWQFDGYDTEAYYQENRGGKPVSPRGAYITSASMKDPHTTSHAPPGVTSVEVMTMVPGDAASWGVEVGRVDGWGYKKEEAYHATKARIEDDLVARFLRLYPSAAGKIVFRESATPVTHSRFTRASEGTSYGIALTPSQFMKNRPGARSDVPGLYLAGASMRQNHGIVGAMLSGREAARAVLEDMGTSLVEESAL